MYLEKLSIRRLKRVRKLDLDFTHDGRPRMWTVIIGENGTAKTSLLQSIALAAAGSRQVNTLIGSAVRYLRDQRSDEPLNVEASFSFTPTSRSLAKIAHPLLQNGDSIEDLCLRSKVWLETRSSSLYAQSRYAHGRSKSRVGRSKRDPLDVARAENLPLWFVTGYGISRVLPDSIMTPNLARPSIERLEPLFGSAGLVSTAFANHFLRKDMEEGRRAGETSELFSRVLKKALALGGDDLFPDLVDLELRGQTITISASGLIDSDRFFQRLGKEKRAILVAGVALSHGYQSTFAWIADLVGHILLESKTELDTTEMEGLVLIDEIDLYLHPTWQAQLITALKRVFPKMQFVATTHSPVVLSALAPHEIVRLVSNDVGDVVQGGWTSVGGEFEPGIQNVELQPDPRLMTGGELYRAWFGLDRLTPNPIGKELRLYRILSSHPARTKAQTEELRELRDFLRKYLEAHMSESEAQRILAEFSEQGDAL